MHVIQDQILAEAREIAAKGGSFTFPPLKPSLLPKLSQDGPRSAATTATAAGGKRGLDQAASSADPEAKRPKQALIEEKLFAAIPLPERPNVEWIKDSQVKHTY